MSTETEQQAAAAYLVDGAWVCVACVEAGKHLEHGPVEHGCAGLTAAEMTDVWNEVDGGRGFLGCELCEGNVWPKMDPLEWKRFMAEDARRMAEYWEGLFNHVLDAGAQGNGRAG